MPEQKCLICYEDSAVYSALACGHVFCNECYGTYLGHKISDEGHSCIFARCPEEKVGLRMPHHRVSRRRPARLHRPPCAPRQPVTPLARARAQCHLLISDQLVRSLVPASELSVSKGRGPSLPSQRPRGALAVLSRRPPVHR